jgi:hypothetical protein
MPQHWLARALALSAVTASACALDRAGEELLIERDSPAVDASAPETSGFDASGHVDPAIGGGADVGASRAPPLDVDAERRDEGDATKSEAQAKVDADKLDAPADVSPEAEAEDGGACEALSRCCRGLSNAAPPVAFACLLGAAQADGGDAGTCASILAGFTASRLCP